MSDRSITVRLRMMVRDFITGVAEAEAAARRLLRLQRQMNGSAADLGKGLKGVAIGAAALGGAGGAIKVLPGLLNATATAGAALPPMLLGAAASGGVLATSLKGVGAAAGQVLKSKDPFDGLGKNARALVFEVKALQPAMAGVRQGLQDQTLHNAAANLRILATRALPQVRRGLNELAYDWGRTFDQITDSVADPTFTRAFNTATLGADWFFDEINMRIPATVRSVSTLVQSADPLARAFGQSLVTSLDRFNGAIERATRSGSLDAYFARGAKGAGEFMAIARGVLQITGMVVREGQKQGGTLADTRASLDAYLATGRGAADVAGIVQTLTTSYEGLRDVLGPLGGIARDALADPATADAIGTMFDVLSAGTKVLRIIFDLFQSLGDPMQSVVLAGIGLGVVFGRLNKAP